MHRTRTVALVLLAGLPAGVRAQATFNETEPNDDKLRASGPFVLAPGDRIAGNSTSATGTGLDYFIVQTTPAPLAIYKHRLTVTTTGTAGHTASIRGRDRLGGLLIPSTDATLQTSASTTAPPRHVAWYGFGRGERLTVRINGGSTTTADYAATLDTTPVSATDLGTFPGGFFTITSLNQGHTTDTEVWVYDGSLNPIPGYNNDDEPSPGTSTHAKLGRDFVHAGTFYIAISSSNLANSLDSTPDDRDTTSDVLDSPGALINSVTTANQNVSFLVTDGAGVDHPVSAVKPGAFDVVWFRFSVTEAPPEQLGVCCVQPFEVCFRGTGPGCAAIGGVFTGVGTSCANTDCPQPGACCLSDFTCFLTGESQCTAAGGVFHYGFLCDACTPPPAGTVAIVAAAAGSTGGQIDGNYTDVQAKLAGTGLFPQVVIYNATRGVPTLQYLRQFSAVLTWTNANYFDADALGNALADYVDAGGGVVVATFANSSTTPYRWLLGRWGPYEIIPSQGGNSAGAATLGAILIPGHPIMAAVSSIAGGATNQRPSSTLLTPHGLKVAEWSNGKTLVAVSTQYPRRADLGLYPPSTDANSTGWTATTDGARLMANALAYAGRGNCFANCDGSTVPPVANVADFTCFLQKFAASDPYANCDGSTTPPAINVADFTCFLQKFAAGCP